MFVFLPSYVEVWIHICGKLNKWWFTRIHSRGDHATVWHLQFPSLVLHLLIGKFWTFEQTFIEVFSDNTDKCSDAFSLCPRHRWRLLLALRRVGLSDRPLSVSLLIDFVTDSLLVTLTFTKTDCKVLVVFLSLLLTVSVITTVVRSFKLPPTGRSVQISVSNVPEIRGDSASSSKSAVWFNV